MISDLRAVYALLFVALFATAARATPMTVFFSFVASNFSVQPGWPPLPPPQDPVTGSVSLTYDPALAGGVLESGSIDTIDLTIAGHVYTVAELIWILSGTPSQPYLYIGSTAGVSAPGPDSWDITGFVDPLSGQLVQERIMLYHVLGNGALPNGGIQHCHQRRKWLGDSGCSRTTCAFAN
jgi:hypothetical protein